MAVARPRVELWRGLQVDAENVEKQKNGWGEDRQKVLQLMLGHFDQKNSATVDLLGFPGAAAPGSDLLELDQEQCLPSGWEKFLDLKTGAVYYVNSATGNRTSTEGGGHIDSKHQMLTRGSGEKLVKSGGGGGDDSQSGAREIGRLDLRLNLWISEDSNLGPATVQDSVGRRDSHSVSESSNMSSMVSPSASSSPSSCVSSDRTSFNDMSSGLCIADQTEISTKNSSNHDDSNSNDNINISNKMTTSTATAAMVLVGCPRCLMYVMLSREDSRCPKCKSAVLLDFPHVEFSKRPRTSA